MGPWEHNCSFAVNLGERQFPNASGDVIDVNGELIRWFDRWLKGIDNGIDEQAPVRIYVMGDNVWRNEHEWPLARTRYTPLFLTSEGDARTLDGDGALRWEAVGQSGEEPLTFDSFVYDPANPVPSRVPTVPLTGICDRSPIERRDDVLVYTSEPLEEDVEITGPVVAKLLVSTSGADTDFMCMLVDVTPEGKALNVTDGAVRLRYNNTYTPRTVVANEPIEAEVRLGNTSQVFKKGHRIRLEVTSSNFPMYDRNHNTAARIGTDAELLVVENRVYHGASVLVLPVIPR